MHHQPLKAAMSKSTILKLLSNMPLVKTNHNSSERLMPTMTSPISMPVTVLRMTSKSAMSKRLLISLAQKISWTQKTVITTWLPWLM